jgi:hypothetical protein
MDRRLLRMLRHAARRTPVVTLLALACAGAATVIAPPARAEITRIEIDRVASPAFEGASFGDVGQYEKLVGRAFGEVDPNDPEASRIADIDRAPRNAAGRVEYATDVVILRPIDSAKANGRLLYEPTNRGTVLSLAVLNDAPVRNDPVRAGDAGNGFLMRRGYTLLFSGWDVTAPIGGARLLAKAPIARHDDGEPIVGPALEELVVDEDARTQMLLTYPAATTKTSAATLTMRRRQGDARIPFASDRFVFETPRTVRLLPEGTLFERGMIYELRYDATEPWVAGLAFAMVRDLAVFARRQGDAKARSTSPFAGRVERVYGFAVSQTARFLRDFVHLGFNRAPEEGGAPAFDGILNWIAGPSGGFFNFRFAQPARTHRQRIGRVYPEREFPFTYADQRDPVTGRSDGRGARCEATKTCPKILEANSSNEYWVKVGSLLHTDLEGKDFVEAPYVRTYLVSSIAHQAASGPGLCRQPRNPVTGRPVLRALLHALDAWVSDGTPPPPSRVPKVADGTLVSPLPRVRVGFPAMPGVLYDGLVTTGERATFGESFSSGVLSQLPPRRLDARPYPVLVPATDADAHDRAGIRLPEIEVPVATHTGWARRAPENGGDDLCDQFGQRIPFAKTRAERLATGDPRPSLEERYTSHEDYVTQVAKAAAVLVEERVMLPEDAERAVRAAEASDVRR